jgi:RND family efflux transporter MFP subunit
MKSTFTGLTVLALVLAFAGCGRRRQPSPESQPPPVPVRVQTIRSVRQPATQEVVGTVRARLRATIEAKVSGRIDTMTVSLGQAVKAGDLLARLDVKEIQAKLDQATAAFQHAKRDYQRASTLVREQAMTRAEFDGDEARYKMTQGAMAEAQSMLDEARVVAPFDGVITSKLADVGDLALPGKPLVKLESPDRLQFVADVPEEIVGRLTPGARAPIRFGAGFKTVAGQVSEIAPAADPTNRTVQVELDLPRTPGVRSGQFGRLLVPLADTEGIQVPASAVVQRGQMELVFVVTDQHARLRLVRTGKSSGNNVDLLSGVAPGEQIVVDGAAELRDGQPVEVK